MKYNFERMLKCHITFLIIFIFIIAGFLYLTFSFWTLHNENWDNIQNNADDEIIEENFAKQEKILEQEAFLLYWIMIPYLAVGLPLVFLSGLTWKKVIPNE